MDRFYFYTKEGSKVYRGMYWPWKDNQPKGVEKPWQFRRDLDTGEIIRLSDNRVIRKGKI